MPDSIAQNAPRDQAPPPKDPASARSRAPWARWPGVVLGIGLCIAESGPLQARPSLEVTAKPTYGSTQHLQGDVGNVDPATHELCVYLFKEGLGWFTKPTELTPNTPLSADGTWSVNVSSGFCDRWATQYEVILKPRDTTPRKCPLATVEHHLPPAVPGAISSLRIDRNPLLERPLIFAKRRWVIKDSGNAACRVGPGFDDPGIGNIFSPDNVFVDELGLHLRIARNAGLWHAAEVWLDETLGFGEYRILIDPLLSDLDPQAVFGAFTFDREAPPFFRELDFELSRFGNPRRRANAQFVVQPSTDAENLSQFSIPLPELALGLTYSMRWRRGEVMFSLYRGHHSGNLPPSHRIHRSTRTGSAVPTAGHANFRLNLWLFRGASPQSDLEQEVVIRDFSFHPDQHGARTATSEATAERPTAAQGAQGTE